MAARGHFFFCSHKCTANGVLTLESSSAQETATPGAGSSSPPPPTSSQITSSPKSSPEPEDDNLLRAEKVKELGNVAFKAGKYADAIEQYTKAIGEW
jgi:DnaJ family protein C protein 7